MESNFKNEYTDLSESGWDYEKNYPFKPKHFKPRSNFKVWWKCPVNNMHRWRTQINVRSKGHGCPYCAGKRVNHTNSLMANFPEVARDWHPSKNGDLTPDDVTFGSSKEVYWKCIRSHEWESPVYSRTTGNRGCKECYEEYGRKKPRVIRDKEKSLAFKAPDIASQWHPTRNNVGPEEVGRNARHEYCGYVNTVVMSGQRLRTVDVPVNVLNVKKKLL